MAASSTGTRSGRSCCMCPWWCGGRALNPVASRPRSRWSTSRRPCSTGWAWPRRCRSMASPSGPPWWRATRCRRARCLRKESNTPRPPQSAVVRWPQKLIVHHAEGDRDVYDLAEDPHERDSLASEARALVADLCRHQQTGEESDRAPVTPSQEVTERLGRLAIWGAAPLRRPRSWRTASTPVIPMSAGARCVRECPLGGFGGRGPPHDARADPGVGAR